MDKTIKFISLQLTRDYVHLKNSSSWMHFSYNKCMYVESTTKPIGWLSINIAQLTCSSLCVYHTSENYPICSWSIVVRSQVLWCFDCFCCCLCVRIHVPWLLCLCSRSGPLVMTLSLCQDSCDFRLLLSLRPESSALFAVIVFCQD